MSTFESDDYQGTQRIVSNQDVILEADRDQTGAGDLVFRTGGVERARIDHAGTGTGWPSVIGGSVSALGDVALPIAGTTVQLADRSEPVFPTVEEKFSSRTIEATMAPAGSPFIKPIFTAPFPLRVRDIWIANYGGALSTLDGSNNWSYRPRRYRVATNFAADFVDILDSAGTNFNPTVTQLQGQSQRFYGVTYSETNALFRTGDQFVLRIAVTGTPSSLSEFCVTVRWEPA